jgi:predicted DNA-binding protein
MTTKKTKTVIFRLPAELRTEIDTYLAKHEETTLSSLIREALRKFLDV